MKFIQDMIKIKIPVNWVIENIRKIVLAVTYYWLVKCPQDISACRLP
jgi:hypothetical protein